MPADRVLSGKDWVKKCNFKHFELKLWPWWEPYMYPCITGIMIFLFILMRFPLFFKNFSLKTFKFVQRIWVHSFWLKTRNLTEYLESLKKLYHLSFSYPSSWPQVPFSCGWFLNLWIGTLSCVSIFTSLSHSNLKVNIIPPFGGWILQKAEPETDT